MRRRRLLLGAGLLALLVSAGILLWFSSRWPGVTQANFDRIQKGATLDEVKALLGGRPHRKDDYHVVIEATGEKFDMIRYQWEAPNIVVSVVINKENRVYDKDIVVWDESFMDRLLRLVGR
jgi:hypothetical protein